MSTELIQMVIIMAILISNLRELMFITTKSMAIVMFHVQCLLTWSQAPWTL